jgi:hypothetical protein
MQLAVVLVLQESLVSGSCGLEQLLGSRIASDEWKCSTEGLQQLRTDTKRHD